LVAKLSDGDKGTVYLRIERRIRASSVKEAIGKHVLGRGTRQHKQTDPTPPTDSDSSKPDDGQVVAPEGKQKKIKKYAVDELRLFDPKRLERDQLLVDHLIFNTKPMSLPQLVVLACAINDNWKDYHFFEKNCYWFCHCAAQALQEGFNYESVPVPGKRRQATWHGIPTDDLWKEVDFKVLLNKYNNMWSVFEQEIQSTINHPDNQHLKEANKRVEEVERRAEEERKRADEERKRAEEERNRAEDLERQLAELKAQLAQSKP